MRTFMLAAAFLAVGSPAFAQFGALIDQGTRRAKQINDFRWTDEEKAELGAAVSEKVRQRYGVVQSKPDLPWTFIVLDTDAVNAFAAPHGYVHVTRGALALASSEAELAGVLAHEILHVAEEHTIKALRNQTLKGAAAEEALKNNGLLEFLADAAYASILDNAYSRGDENEADSKGVALANAAGYAPQGLGAFLTALTERNKASTEKRGMFDSHPGMQARLERIARAIDRGRLTATATAEARYGQTITYTPVPQTELATVEAGTRGLAGGNAKAEPEGEAGAAAGQQKDA